MHFYYSRNTYMKNKFVVLGSRRVFWNERTFVCILLVRFWSSGFIAGAYRGFQKGDFNKLETFLEPWPEGGRGRKGDKGIVSPLPSLRHCFIMTMGLKRGSWFEITCQTNTNAVQCSFDRIEWLYLKERIIFYSLIIFCPNLYPPPLPP